MGLDFQMHLSRVKFLTLQIKKADGDSSVVEPWSNGLGLESRQERRENFVLQGQLSVLTLMSVSVPPTCYRSNM